MQLIKAFRRCQSSEVVAGVLAAAARQRLQRLETEGAAHCAILPTLLSGPENEAIGCCLELLHSVLAGEVLEPDQLSWRGEEEG